MAQYSRSKESIVYRIFFLEKREHSEVPTFERVESRIKEALLHEAVAEERGQYLEKLRHRYHLNSEKLKEQIPSNFQPFALS